MAVAAANTMMVACPKCGHEQAEPRSAYSTVCKQCHANFRLGEKPDTRAVREVAHTEITKRRVSCFQCGTDLDVPEAAESTMCKRCSSHVDLRDYSISQTVSKNFRTYGRLVIEEKGYILNTDSLVGDAVIKGRFIGKISARRTLEIHSGAHIKGTFSTGCLVIPTKQHFYWPTPLEIGGADIAGEVCANIVSTGTIHLRSSARLFGDVVALNLAIESGAVVVGQMKIGQPPNSAGRG
jgi:cytoskeletal protein CcmA (bactofilin family)/DNA-directed RNA polymerase subunit RPC12/RpoP